LQEQFDDVAGEFFRLMESPGIAVEGLLHGECIVVDEVEGEVSGFAEGGIACYSEAFGVVEDDVWVLVGDGGVEPGKAAAGELDLGGGDALKDGVRRGDVALELALTDGGWSIGLDGPNVVGNIAVPNADSTKPWKLEFQRLKFAGSQDDADSDHSAAADRSAADPRRVPAIDFHAAEMIWNERQFGDVQASLTKLNDGLGLQRLSISAANFTAEAKGEWRGKEAGSGRIEGSLASSDVGSTLKQLGYDAVIEARTGKIDFDMSWVGAPTADALKDATGHIEVALDKGQITGIKPGAGRVVGLASVAALPRRLALDFSDLTDKGLAFDTVRGGFDLRDGNAFTDNVLIKGPAADIGLIGRVGLKNKDYDQTAVVTGSVGNSLSIPVASALVGGPVVGAAVLLFTQVFKQPLKGLARGYYRITGSWDNPTVERIKSADAAAATAEVPR